MVTREKPGSRAAPGSASGPTADRDGLAGSRAAPRGSRSRRVGPGADDQGPVRSVARAAEVLRALEAGPQSLGRVAHQSGLTKPTAHRLLASLGYRQMVIQDPASGQYLLGPGAFGIADAVMRGVAGLGVLVDPILRRLSRATGETVALYVRAGLKRICVGQAASPQPVRYTAQVGGTRPIHTGSMGKVLLAMCEAPERRDLLEQLPLTAETPATITDRATLEAELGRIAGQGYATSRGERVVGAASISAPVFGGDRRILAALSIIGPDRRLDDAAMERFRPWLEQAAEEITRQVATHGGAGAGVARSEIPGR